MAKGEILISIDTDGFLDPKLFFLMAEGKKCELTTPHNFGSRNQSVSMEI